jgi:hypothetical protein
MEAARRRMVPALKLNTVMTTTMMRRLRSVVVVRGFIYLPAIGSQCSTSTGEGKKKKKKKKPKKKKAQQSEPPRVGLSKLFPDGKYPEGEIQEYKNEYVSILPLRRLWADFFQPLLANNIRGKALSGEDGTRK